MVHFLKGHAKTLLTTDCSEKGTTRDVLHKRVPFKYLR